MTFVHAPRSWRPAHFAVPAIVAALFVAAASQSRWFVGEDEFVLVNETGAPLTDLRLYRRYQRPGGELKRLPVLAPGETVRVPHSMAFPFVLCIEFRDGEGRWLARDLAIVDPEQPGEDRVVFEPGHVVAGKQAELMR
jgi:hypothetical protein